MLRLISRIVPAAAAFAFIATTGLYAQEPAEPEAQQCRIQVFTEVAILDQPVVVEAAYTDIIGESLRAALDEESGVDVVAIEEGAEPMSLVLTLDTERAAEGEWEIALEGDAGECRGTVTVARFELEEPQDQDDDEDQQDQDDSEDPREEDEAEEPQDRDGN